jgi:hypothetical protein
MNKVNVMYENIFNRIKDGTTVFGESIDLSNPKEVAVIFYYYAKMEERIGHKKERDIYEMMINLQETRM